MLGSAQKAYLILADKTIYEGKSFGKRASVIGEIVFSTGMTGYQETLTDPSFYGQIVTQTFPLMGNYGINSFDSESDKAYLSGYIVREWCEMPSNFRMESTLNDFLIEQNIVAICDIDTRSLTRKIRECGVMNGMITTQMPDDIDKAVKEIQSFKVLEAVKNVSCVKKSFYKGENADKNIVLFDFGYKHNILRELLKRGCDVTVVPYNTTVDEIKNLNPDGIMLSNGPGDPKQNEEVVENLKEIIKLQIPIFGICLGHQLMALANGANTQKLKYGHRGANQPVIDLERNRTYITSQNHGYAVIGDTIPHQIGNVSHINANDHSCEGIVYKNCPAFTVQFHPEACSGPQDTAYLFDKFIASLSFKRMEC